MDLRNAAIAQLNEHRIMSIATLRADGWPQTTIVGYINEELTLYCFVARASQKFSNISRDKRVSIAIGADYADPMKIKGLSLAANAAVVDEREEFDRLCEKFLGRHPEYKKWALPNPAISPMLRITPEIVSVLDYTKGFGHAETLKLSPGDAGATRTHSKWFGVI